MKKRTGLTLAAVAAVVVLIVLAARYTQGVDEAPTSAAATGEAMTLKFVRNPVPVPELTMQDLEGRTLSTRDLRGKVTIVNFWATWCRPCREEIPHLIKLQEAYREHLQIIGVSNDEAPPETVKKFAAEHGINYPIVMETAELRRAFPGVFAIPASFVLDRQARIVQKHSGLIDPAIFEHETRALAGLPTNAVIETVEDTGQVLLANAAHATQVPGLDLSKLSPEKRVEALKRLNSDGCPCGCSLTLAQCRVNDADCAISLPIARKLVDQIAASTPAQD
jgi:thiol-disulfide isomerase/thioredoxin